MLRDIRPSRRQARCFIAADGQRRPNRRLVSTVAVVDGVEARLLDVGLVVDACPRRREHCGSVVDTGFVDCA